MNGPASIFFTVGCEKAFNKNEKGHWVNGYLELAFNYVELIADAQFYFKLFFRLKQMALDTSVRYNFELEAAHFIKANADGMAMSIWISTSVLASQDAAKSAWEHGLDTVVGFLRQQVVPAESHYTRIY